VHQAVRPPGYSENKLAGVTEACFVLATSSPLVRRSDQLFQPSRTTSEHSFYHATIGCTAPYPFIPEGPGRFCNGTPIPRSMPHPSGPWAFPHSSKPPRGPPQSINHSCRTYLRNHRHLTQVPSPHHHQINLPSCRPPPSPHLPLAARELLLRVGRCQSQLVSRPEHNSRTGYGQGILVAPHLWLATADGGAEDKRYGEDRRRKGAIDCGVSYLEL